MAEGMGDGRAVRGVSETPAERCARLEEFRNWVVSKFDGNRELLTAELHRIDQQFEASQEAIRKSDASQDRLNEKNNEFRGSLNDQAKASAAAQENFVKKLDLAAVEGRLQEVQRTTVSVQEFGGLRDRVSALEKSASSDSGREHGSDQAARERASARSVAISIAGVVFGFLGILVAIITLVLRFKGGP